MPSNEQRRATAKRALERRNERQVKRAKRRKRIAIGSVLGVVVIVLAVVGIVLWNNHQAKVEAQQRAAYKANTCAYKKNKQEAGQLPKNKKVGLPPNPNPKPRKGTLDLRLDTTAGAVPVTLDRAQAPCTVQSLQHLVSKKFYDNTKCHREVDTDKPIPLKVLQCGDPRGDGTGGPGYTVPDEKPKGLKPAQVSPALKQKLQQSGAPDLAVYPRGSIAMAKSQQPNSTGSQFFLVYGDSYLPPEYNLVGRVSDKGMQVLDDIAKAGITPKPNPQTGKPDPDDGAPKKPVTIRSATIANKR